MSYRFVAGLILAWLSGNVGADCAFCGFIDISWFSPFYSKIKSKKPKRRGIRQPKFIPGDWNHNLYVADYSHIPGNNPVSGEATMFFGECETFSKLMLLSLTENNEIVQGKFPGQHHRVKSNGYNLPLMKFFRMSKKRVDEFPHSIAFDICEQLLRAIETSDDFFFTDLARICKFEKSRPIISLEYWLTPLLSRDWTVT